MIVRNQKPSSWSGSISLFSLAVCGEISSGTSQVTPEDVGALSHNVSIHLSLSCPAHNGGHCLSVSSHGEQTCVRETLQCGALGYYYCIFYSNVNPLHWLQTFLFLFLSGRRMWGRSWGGCRLRRGHSIKAVNLNNIKCISKRRLRAPVKKRNCRVPTQQTWSVCGRWKKWRADAKPVFDTVCVWIVVTHGSWWRICCSWPHCNCTHGTM